MANFPSIYLEIEDIRKSLNKILNEGIEVKGQAGGILDGYYPSPYGLKGISNNGYIVPLNGALKIKNNNLKDVFTTNPYNDTITISGSLILTGANATVTTENFSSRNAIILNSETYGDVLHIYNPGSANDVNIRYKSIQGGEHHFFVNGSQGSPNTGDPIWARRLVISTNGLYTAERGYRTDQYNRDPTATQALGYNGIEFTKSSEGVYDWRLAIDNNNFNFVRKLKSDSDGTNWTSVASITPAGAISASIVTASGDITATGNLVANNAIILNNGTYGNVLHVFNNDSNSHIYYKSRAGGVHAFSVAGTTAAPSDALSTKLEVNSDGVAVAAVVSIDQLGDASTSNKAGTIYTCLDKGRPWKTGTSRVWDNFWYTDYEFYKSADSGSTWTLNAFLDGAWNAQLLDFTGQHRSQHNLIIDNINNYVGLIVSSNGKYCSQLSDFNKKIIEINEAIPSVDLSCTRNDKKVFGVISDSEDGNTREYAVGTFVSVCEKHEEDNRIIINSLGEGGIWVCNINGNFENGDYITSCEIPGYGMKQDDDLLHNYTVGKITCDCNFDLNSDVYKCEEFEFSGSTYRKAFVGCTYHCG